MANLFPAVRDLQGVKRVRTDYDPAALVASFLPIVKDHLRLSSDAEDPLLTIYTQAAIVAVENHSGVALVPQEHAWTFTKGVPAGTLQVFPGPVTDLSIGGSPADVLDPGTPRNPYALVELAASESLVAIVFKAGVSSIEDVEAGLRQAVLVTVAHYYENREFAAAGGFSRIPALAEFLLEPYRNLVLGV